jgi:hypothetical protein
MPAMLILKASSNAIIFAAKRLRREASSVDADRASEPSGPNRTTTTENNEKKGNRHA